MINLFRNNSVIKIKHSGNLITSNQIKSILDKIITPSLTELGFKFNGDYLWYTDSINSIRKILSYQRLKGETGILQWGVCLDFVPTISGSALRWDRTEKSLKLHLFEKPQDYTDYWLNGRKIFSRVSHSGLTEFNKTLKKHYTKNKNEIIDWFSKINNLEDLINTTQNQIDNITRYNMHHPNPKYIMIFLKLHDNNKTGALTLLDSLDINPLIKEKIIKIINKKPG